MPTFVLKVKCELENIKELMPQEGNLWKLNISSGDGSFRRDNITVSKHDIIDLDGSKGTANFVIKWDKTSSQSYIKLVDVKKLAGKYTSDDSGKWVSIIALDCRGLEPLQVGLTFRFDVFTIINVVQCS